MSFASSRAFRRGCSIESESAAAATTSSGLTSSTTSLPKALRVTTARGDAPTTFKSAGEKERLWERTMTMARQHVGVMETYDGDVEEALRRAVRDAFTGGDSGVRVGRRVRARYEALRKSMRRRSAGASTGLLIERGGVDDSARGLLGSRGGRGERETAAAPTNDDVALLNAFDGEDDVEWGARLSKRKLRRLEASAATTNAASGRGNDLEMIKYEELDAAVYAVMRSPMTMGALKRVFYETRDRLGDDFKPRTVLDFGSGPIPSTLFAARAVFGEDVGTTPSASMNAKGKTDAAWNDVRVAFVDSNPGMMRFARRIVGYAEKIAEERRSEASAVALGTTTTTAKTPEKLDTVVDERIVAKEDEDGIIRLDFSDFEIGDARRQATSNGVTRASSAIRLKTPHPWHESEGVRTSASLHGANRRDGFDMVVSSYALGEIPVGVARVGRSGRVERNQRQLDVTIRQLWDKVAPGGILVVVEPGTPRGSALVRRARALVLEVARRDMEQNARRMNLPPDLSAVEAYAVAPCQHDGACPIKEEHREDGFATWCHFPQRALRSKYAREVNQSARPYQDEKFSYVVLRKQPRAEARRRAALAARRARDARTENDSDDAEEFHHESVVRESVEEWSRVIRSPKKRKGHVVVELCTARGEIERAVIAKSHGLDEGIGREGYKFARKLRWGDLWPFTNKTVTKPGDQRKFELEAARFYAEHAARIEAASEPPRRSIGEPMDPALQAFMDDDDEDEDDDNYDEDLDDDDDLDEDILALVRDMSIEDLAALRRRVRDDAVPSEPTPEN